eukprot:CAMPEP_0179224278 /NCGR_PEP_ID=MMETSP0797-20121207/7696_1 /TAXON_ID=47934 /ORGANISM="Dinophysis acuminata, Strain DAEP01" /LENGTH=58 /DNA_ID=CAMNT_0020931231 /DNA_START=25 /DNA_END=201 /DNA_ORIENTATION=-
MCTAGAKGPLTLLLRLGASSGAGACRADRGAAAAVLSGTPAEVCPETAPRLVPARGIR